MLNPNKMELPPVFPFIIAVVAMCIIIGSVVLAFGETTDHDIARAIFKAEGGLKAEYLFGIRSISYETPAQAWQYCLNTIRNQRIRHSKHTCGLTYIECLSNRYCPLNAKNDPKGLNQNWLSNVSYFLKEGN